MRPGEHVAETGCALAFSAVWLSIAIGVAWRVLKWFGVLG